LPDLIKCIPKLKSQIGLNNLESRCCKSRKFSESCWRYSENPLIAMFKGFLKAAGIMKSAYNFHPLRFSKATHIANSGFGNTFSIAMHPSVKLGELGSVFIDEVLYLLLNLS
jgi:hypothetical protein